MSFHCSSFLPLAKEQGVSVMTTTRRFRGFSRCASSLIYLDMLVSNGNIVHDMEKWKVCGYNGTTHDKSEWWFQPILTILESWDITQMGWILNTFEISSLFFMCPFFGGKEQHAMKGWRIPFSFLKRFVFLLQKLLSLKKSTGVAFYPFRASMLRQVVAHRGPLWCRILKSLFARLVEPGQGLLRLLKRGQSSEYTWWFMMISFRRAGTWQLPVPFCLSSLGNPKVQLWTFHTFHTFHTFPLGKFPQVSKC